MYDEQNENDVLISGLIKFVERMCEFAKNFDIRVAFVICHSHRARWVPNASAF